MELIFAIPENKSWRVKGPLDSYNFEMKAADSPFSITLRIKVEENEILNGSDCTPIIKLPDSEHGAIRLGGAQTMTVHKDGIAEITCIINGFYVTFEEAAAAEMQYQMEKKR